MGDIADMHVEAWAAGLDPNEMDGADWADFYEEDSGFPPNPWLIWNESRAFLSWLGREAEEQNCLPIDVLCLYFPDLKFHEATLTALTHLSEHKDPEGPE